ncbi:MAG: hypothetical protein E7571_06140 [Ruminococcaceae bacterium]|nr:hypothetical protein [Oscillospiraceae bacterium]
MTKIDYKHFDFVKQTAFMKGFTGIGVLLLSVAVAKFLLTVILIITPTSLKSSEDFRHAENILCGVFGIAVFLWHTLSDKGVFVFHNKVSVRNGMFPVFHRNFDILKIQSVQYVMCCRDDPDYFRYRYFSNLIEGESGMPAAKLYMTNGKIYFVGVDDTGGLVTEIQHRLDSIIYPKK